MLNLLLGFWVIYIYFIEVNVKLYLKDVIFYFFFCGEYFSGFEFLKIFGGVFVISIIV